MQKEVDRVNQKSGEDALEVMHAIVHLYRSQQMRGVRAGREAEMRAGLHELAHMEIKVLRFFGRHPGATQSDLAAHSGRDKAQVARLIKGLRDAGMLDATADEADRRSTRLTLSSAGQAVCEELHRQSGALGRIALAGLDTDDQARLMALLARVRANLEAGAA
jgi:DNA-binding MarR family transcriptional regulator